MKELLNDLAEKHHTCISTLRLNPVLKQKSLGDLYRISNKEQYPIQEWLETVSYLLGYEVCYQNYEQVEDGLKPFSTAMRL